MFSKIRSLIFKLDPETAHDLAIKALKFNPIPQGKIKNNKSIQTEIFGKIIPNPIGIAAGFDKDASLSNPAAIPIGFGIIFPKISVWIDLLFLILPWGIGLNLRALMAKSCAVSGSNLNINDLIFENIS